MKKKINMMLDKQVADISDLNLSSREVRLLVNQDEGVERKHPGQQSVVDGPRQELFLTANLTSSHCLLKF